MEVQSTLTECLSQEGCAGCHRQGDRARVDHPKVVTKGADIWGRGKVPGWCEEADNRSATFLLVSSGHEAKVSLEQL